MMTTMMTMQTRLKKCLSTKIQPSSEKVISRTVRHISHAQAHEVQRHSRRHERVSGIRKTNQKRRSRSKSVGSSHVEEHAKRKRYIPEVDQVSWNKSEKQECILVGCVPPACCPYLPACSARGGVYLVPGGGVPGPGGWCTWSRGVYLVPGVYLVRGEGIPPLWTESQTPVKI